MCISIANQRQVIATRRSKRNAALDEHDLSQLDSVNKFATSHALFTVTGWRSVSSYTGKPYCNDVGDLWCVVLELQCVCMVHTVTHLNELYL